MTVFSPQLRLRGVFCGEKYKNNRKKSSFFPKSLLQNRKNGGIIIP